jgi:hypothetical protein
MQRVAAWCRSLQGQLEAVEAFCATAAARPLDAQFLQELNQLRALLEDSDPSKQSLEQLDALLLDLDSLVDVPRRSANDWIQLLATNGFQPVSDDIVAQSNAIQPVFGMPSPLQVVYARGPTVVALRIEDPALPPTNVLIAQNGFQADQPLFVYDLGGRPNKSEMFTLLEEFEPLDRERYQRFRSAAEFPLVPIPYSLFDCELQNLVLGDGSPLELGEEPNTIFYYLIGPVQELGWLAATKRAKVKRPAGSDYPTSARC